MQRPKWRKELRDLLDLPTHEERQHALEVWEARWLVDVHTVTVLSKFELTHARAANLVEAAGQHVQHKLGTALAKVMGMVTTQEHDDFLKSLEIRGDAWAIRLEPKNDV